MSFFDIFKKGQIDSAMIEKIKKELSRSLAAGRPDPEFFVTDPDLTPAAIKSVLDSGSNIDIQNMIDLFMRVDPDFLGKYQDRLSIARKALPSWTPASEDQADIDFCEEVKEALEPLLTSRFIRHQLKANFRRFAVSEITWEIDGSRLIPAKITPLPARCFDLSVNSPDEEDRKDLNVMIYDLETGEFKKIPPFKTITTLSVFDMDHSVLSLGEALARIMVIKYYCLHKQWTRFNELFAIPPTIIKADVNMSDPDFDDLKDAVDNMGSNLKGVLKGATDVVFPQPGDGKPDKFTSLIQTCKDAIYMAIIGQPATSSSGKESSYASMKILYGIREDIITDDLDMVSDAFNESIVKPFVFLNYGEKYKAPSLSLMIPSQKSEKAEADKKLKDLGVNFKKEYFSKRYDLNEDEFDIAQQAAPAFPAMGELITLKGDTDAINMKVKELQEWEKAADLMSSDITPD